MMGKLILILLILLGFGLSRPDSRAVILDRAGPLMNPVYGFITNQQLRRLVEDLEASQERTGALPDGRSGDFTTWMRFEYENESRRTDAWGNPFVLELGISNFFVISAGPDGIHGSDDDLSATGVRQGIRP